MVQHVYQRWLKGTHEELTSRTFSAVQGDEPFKMYGVALVLEYLQDWGLLPEDIQVLRRLPSLHHLDGQFWQYMLELRIKGDVGAMPEGKQIGGLVYETTESVRRLQGDRPPIPLLRIEDGAGFVVLVSEGVHAILECAINHSRDIAREQELVGQSMFFHSERADHPLWSRITTMAQTSLGARTALDRKSTLDLWFWWDTTRRNGEPSSEFWRSFGRLRTYYNNELGAEVNLLIDKI